MTDESVRIDKWLWAARFFKTRSLAAAAVDNGRVRIDGERIKPARTARIGELLSVDNGAERWEIELVGISGVRGSATLARTLYRETPRSILRRANEATARRLAPEPASMLRARPTKRDRRQLDKVGEVDE